MSNKKEGYISLGEEIGKWENEDPAVTLARLENEEKEVWTSGELNGWPPEERHRHLQLVKQIAELKNEGIEFKKAA